MLLFVLVSAETGCLPRAARPQGTRPRHRTPPQRQCDACNDNEAKMEQSVAAVATETFTMTTAAEWQQQISAAVTSVAETSVAETQD